MEQHLNSEAERHAGRRVSKTGMKYYVTQILENAWRIYSPAGVFMDLIVGEDRALLWDTGYGMGNLHKAVRSITDKPLYIVNSHGHVDHSSGNALFDESVYIHNLDMQLCEEHTGRIFRTLALELVRSMSICGEEDILSCGLSTETYLSQGTGKLRPVSEGHVFDLGKVHLQVIELPGHTMGSIGLIYEEKGILYAGDAVNDGLWLFLPEASNLTTYISTLYKIRKLNPSGLVLSHEDGITRPAVLTDYIDVAENLDYESGIPFSAPLVPGATARMCCRRGFSAEDIGKPGFASIYINKDHLD